MWPGKIMTLIRTVDDFQRMRSKNRKEALIMAVKKSGTASRKNLRESILQRNAPVLVTVDKVHHSDAVSSRILCTHVQLQE